MAISKLSPFDVETFQAASALGSVAGQFSFVALTAAGLIDNPAAGVLALVLNDAPALDGGVYVAGKNYTCAIRGVIKVLAGAAMNAGVAVTTNGSGAAVAATSGQIVNGVLLAPCNSGDLVPMLVMVSIHP